MESLPHAGYFSTSPACFDNFQKQTSLMTSCTLLWKELSDHITSLEQDLVHKSESLRTQIQTLDVKTKESLTVLEERENTIDASVQSALARADQTKEAALIALANGGGDAHGDSEVDDRDGMLMILKRFCMKIDYCGFWKFITSRKKESDVLRTQIPAALMNCVDPARFVLDSISKVFPVDERSAKNGNDLCWACVLVLESLIPVIVSSVLVVTPAMKERAKTIAETWKGNLMERGGGGIANVVTPPDVHTFLQFLVTFGIFVKEDLDLYQKLVIASAWRKQMPRLAVSLGLNDRMPDMIEELIRRGQQVDAVHFIYEAGLVIKFPPVPLLKAFLRDAKKTATPFFEDPGNGPRSANVGAKKEQSSVRAVIKCIDEYKLEKEFPLQDLKKHLEHLEKTGRAEKKKSARANKRTRANNGGGPMPPPAKAGRSTNAHVSSFPNPQQCSPYGYAAATTPPYSYSPATTSPYSYSPEAPHLPLYVYSPEPYRGPPIGYPSAYGGYAAYY